MRIVGKPQFRYRLEERKNGTKYIKVVMYVFDADGEVEVARIHGGDNYWTRNGYGDIEALYEELTDNRDVAEQIAKTNPLLLERRKTQYRIK